MDKILLKYQQYFGFNSAYKIILNFGPYLIYFKYLNTINTISKYQIPFTFN